jgi:trigger factor
MEITHKSLPKSRIAYTVTIPETEIAEFFSEAAENMAKKINVPGFRPGKAPADVVRGKLSPEELREEAYSLAARLAWQKIAVDSRVLPIEDPAVEVTAFEEGKAGELVFAFDVRPEVKVGSWKSIKVTAPKIEPVTDQEVEDVITSLRKAHAQTVVKIEPAQIGDRVEITFSGAIGGVKKDKLTAKKFALTLGDGAVVPGFEDHIVGLKRGDTAKFEVTFPTEHFDKELSGKAVAFELEVDEVFAVVLPEIDAKFAEKFGHDKIEELRSAIKDDLMNHKDEEAHVQRKAQWLAEFDKKVTTEVPENLVRTEVGRSKDSWSSFLMERNLNPKDWLERRGTTMEKMIEDWTKAAESSVRIGLGLAEVAKELGKELKSDEDYQAMLDELVKAPR